MPKDYTNWERVYKVWESLDWNNGCEELQQAYFKLLYETGNEEMAIEQALIMFGHLDPKPSMIDGAQEYDDIQAGEQIWASIQKNSGT